MIRVLLIDDNAADADFICTIFRRANLVGEIVWEKSLQTGVERLAIEVFDIVLMELSPSDAAELLVIRAVRKVAESVLIIALIAPEDGALAESAMANGAQDYLVKNLVTVDALERSVRYAMDRQHAREEKLQMLRGIEQTKELLKHKNRRLKRLYAMAQEFVNHVSHEFRTPLSVIKDYASIISDGVVGPLNGEQRRMLTIVDDRADDLNSMVDDMLDVSKLNAGMLEVSRGECTVASIIERVLPAIERKAITRKAVLQLRLESGLPHVYCDAEKAGRVVSNLCLNAIKSAGEGCEIELWSRIDAGHHNVLVGVTNRGAGISRERLKRISERFAQVEAGVHTDIRGFGIRLNIAFELVKLNFGKMSVAREAGQSSIFSFTLPVANPREIVARNLNQLEANQHRSTSLTLLLAHVDGHTGDSLSGDADRFLNYLLRRNDLLFRSGQSSWLMLLPMSMIELPSFLDRAEQLLNSTNRNRPFAPLPQIDYQVLGAWSPGDGRDELLSTVDHYCSPPELAMV